MEIIVLKMHCGAGARVRANMIGLELGLELGLDILFLGFIRTIDHGSRGNIGTL